MEVTNADKGGEEGGEADTNYSDQTGTRGAGPQYVAYVFLFLGSIRSSLVVIYRVDGTCGQWTFADDAHCFVPFLSLDNPPLLGGGAEKMFTGVRTRSLRPESHDM
jgi:hypothetical protein